MDLAAHLHRIVKVEVVGEHRLRLAFDDGVSGELDASSWDWRGVFEPLRDPAYFARVELDDELGSIRWPNGADVAPETLHLWVARGRDNVSAQVCAAPGPSVPWLIVVRAPERGARPGARPGQTEVDVVPVSRGAIDSPARLPLLG